MILASSLVVLGIYAIPIPIFGGLFVYYYRKWKKQEPMQLKQEQLEYAVQNKQLLDEMAKKVAAEMESGNLDSPQKVQKFIQDWDPGKGGGT